MSGTGRKQPPLVGARGAKSGKSLTATRSTGSASGAGRSRSGGSGGGGSASGGARKPPATKTAGRRPHRGGSGGGSGGGGFFARLFRRLFRLIFGIFWRVTAVLVILVGLATLYDYSTLPAAKSLLDGRSKGSVTMYDDHDQPFAWRGETYKTVSSTEVSPYLRDAIVATEDRRFWHDFGISPRGILGAMFINLSAGRGPFEGNGGSTITQQVAKLLCLGKPYDPKEWKTEAAYEADCRVSSLWRKIREVPYSFAMETKYTKNQILTIYINRAYLGAGTRGFEAAAQRYFDKSASDVTPSEAAMLAGLLKAPSYYAPTNSLARAQARADVIIDLMKEQGYLTLAQAAFAHAHPAVLSNTAETKTGGYFADWLMDAAPDFLTTDTTEDVSMQTTFDPRIQTAAEGAMHDIFESKLKPGSKVQVAIVVMSPDGAVRAMIGGRKNTISGAFNRATQALRQTGSAFKPFVYAAALDEGWSPNDLVDDAPLTINIPGSGPWSPRDYDRDYKGVVTLTTALKYSLNIPAVKIGMAAGLDQVRKVATDFGIKSDLAQGPALSLGVSEVTLLDMVGAYAGILNGGSSVKPYGLKSLSLRGDATPLIGKAGGMGERVISQHADQQLIYMMNQVVNSGTGQRAKLPDREAAGKTGTTQNLRDAWFVGFTADYVVGVWLGNDDNSPLTGVTGGGLPADIWHETMVRIDKDLSLPPRPLPMAQPDQPTHSAPAQTQSQPNTVIGRILQNIFGGGN